MSCSGAMASCFGQRHRILDYAIGLRATREGEHAG